MADSFKIFQQFIDGYADDPLNRTAFGASTAPSATLFTTIFGFPDWFKFIAISAALQVFRPLLIYCYERLMDELFVHAVFKENDPSYDYLLAWLQKQPAWDAARVIQVALKESRGRRSASNPFDNADDHTVTHTTAPFSYLPYQDHAYHMWYKQHRIRLSLSSVAAIYGPVVYLHLDILTLKRTVLDELLLQARNDFIAAQDQQISILAYEPRYENWMTVATRPKRAMDSIILEPGIKDILLADVRDFMSSKSWYTERGIPFRRGYLLYGSPGSGKTSIIHAMAGELGLNVYIISLSQSGMDDSKLGQITSLLPERSIALLEDIDAALDNSKRDLSDENGNETTRMGSPGSNVKTEVTQPPRSRVTLSGLLNVLDGLAACEGRILYATTNNYSALDAALCRAGRLDLHIEFKLASKQQAKELYARFFDPSGALATSINDVDAGDSGYHSSSTSESDLIDLSTTSPEHRLDETSLGDDEKPLVHAFSGHTLAKKLTTERLRTLSSEFANAIPEREFSMASLQGYLMTYKIRPVQAVLDTGAWIEREREAIRKQQRKLAWSAPPVVTAPDGTTNDVS